ncbi:MAG TPA: carbon storage regulator [Tepidisphaeraceae bacterium]|nr:carbon storage regulator [Tepidisphaeraceae bacterium]
MGGLAMLVLSQERGNSIMVDGPEGGCLLTLLQVRGAEVSLLVSHSPAAGKLESWTATLVREATVKVGSTAEVTLVDVRAEKARLGINASKETSVHRLEVWEAIKRENRRASGGDAEDGLAGSPVPRPGDPKPPSLDVRLEGPPAAEGGGE